MKSASKPVTKSFSLWQDGQIIMTPKSIDFNDLAGFLGDPPNGPATLEEIDATVRVAGGRAAVSGNRILKKDAA